MRDACGTLRSVGLTSVAILALSACGGAGTDTEADTQPSTLTVLYGGDERVLGAEGRAYYTPAQFLVFEPLMTWNAEGELEPRIARRWEHSADYRTWTIHLRADARWHDGVPVTAHDVEFTFDLLSHPDVLLELPDHFELHVLDDSTFTITRERRGMYSITDEAAVYNAIYPEHLLRDLDPKDFWDWEFWIRPVGNGPYRYSRHMPGTSVELEAYTDHFLGKPRIDRIVLKFGGSALTELLAGQVDAVPYVDRTDLLSLAGDPRFRVYQNVYSNSVRALVWNHRFGPLGDSAVRRAVTHAIDRRALHRAVDLPEGLPIVDVVHTARQFRRGNVPPPIEHDPGRAMELLEQSGWIDSDGDGVRDRQGQPLQFTVLTFEGLGSRAAVFAQQELRNIGVEMEILTVQNVWEQVETGDFEAAILPVFPAGGLSHTVYFGKESVLGYNNAAVTQLLAEAEESLSPVELDRIYAELMPIFLEDQPVTVLYPEVRTTVAHRRVRGLSSPYWAEPTWHAGELWLEDEE